MSIDNDIDNNNNNNNLLPIANTGRIMKQILPLGAKVSKEAKETMQECVTEFISFVTGEASARCLKENRKTLNGDDICWALTSLGLDNYSEAMLRYLSKFREFEKNKASKSEELHPNTVGSIDFFDLGKGLGQSDLAEPRS